MRFTLCILISFLGCQQRQSSENTTVADTASNEVITQDAFEKPETKYDYQEFYGVFDHESTTKGFSAVLSLRQNGDDLYFAVSVAQGNCRGETEGVVMMLDHNENYYSGFYDSEDCRLQFTFILLEKKVDIKEISLCTLLEKGCSFEGSYLKRNN